MKLTSLLSLAAGVLCSVSAIGQGTRLLRQPTVSDRWYCLKIQILK